MCYTQTMSNKRLSENLENLRTFFLVGATATTAGAGFLLKELSEYKSYQDHHLIYIVSAFVGVTLIKTVRIGNEMKREVNKIKGGK